MKKTNMFKVFGGLAIAASLFFVSCSKTGPAGAAGATGATGATGAAGPNAKFYDFTLGFDNSAGDANTLPGNYSAYSGISGVDTAKDIVLLYEKYTSSTSGTNFYYAMPYTTDGIAYNYVYFRKASSTTGQIYVLVSIEDATDATINPVTTAFSVTYRAIVIKGTAGKNPNLNYSDYNSVKEFYHLND